MKIRRDFLKIDIARMWPARTSLPDQWSGDNFAPRAARVAGQRR
jgi:hypothetical protein